MEGRILIYWPHRRYGFLASNDSPEELFFHACDVISNGIQPAEGRDCTFEIGKYKGRRKGIKVRVLPRPEDALAGKGGVE